jgi:hypothetical protein
VIHRRLKLDDARIACLGERESGDENQRCGERDASDSELSDELTHLTRRAAGNTPVRHSGAVAHKTAETLVKTRICSGCDTLESHDQVLKRYSN